MRQRLTFTRVTERLKFGERKNLLITPGIQSHHGESVMIHGRGNACMASGQTDSLIFIDDLTRNGSSQIHSVVYRNI